MGYNRIGDEDIRRLKELVAGDRVFSGGEIVDDFSHDEMTIYGKYKPEVLIEVKSASEVSAVMKYAGSRRIPVTPRGAGTGLCGGSVPVFGGIMLSTARMNRVLEIDGDNLTMTVEPGVLLSDLYKAAAEKGFLYPPDPGEKGASIGGNVMTNAGGMRAVKYGVTRDYVRGLEAVLPSGAILELGGKVAKNSSGYSLKDLLIGSEGTLAIVTKVILKLIPLPAKTVSLLVPFDSLEACLEAVPPVVKGKAVPTAVEFMQREVIRLGEEFTGKKFPDSSANVYLLLTYDGGDDEEIEKAYENAAEILLEAGASDVFLADKPEKLDNLWGIRGIFLEAIKNSAAEMDECDVVVPRNRITAFINFVNLLEKEQGIRLRSFGHAGDGNIHVYVCRDKQDEKTWKDKLEYIMKSLYDKAGELGGQISGEHGIGHAKIGYLKASLGEEQLALMKAVKEAFDPQNILNPGKVINL